jgi:two-component system OmpR family sensor kinase
MRRWRPSLALVLGGALGGTLALSFAGLVALRYLGPVTGFKLAAAGLGLGIALATLVLGWLLLRLLLRPIKALGRYAEDMDQPPAHFGTREIHATARRVIAMAERLRDREATIRSFTDHVTHEIKSPVSAIRAAAEMLAEDVTEADRPLVAAIEGAARQIETQLAALGAAARAREVLWQGQATLAEVLGPEVMGVLVMGVLDLPPKGPEPSGSPVVRPERPVLGAGSRPDKKAQRGLPAHQGTSVPAAIPSILDGIAPGLRVTLSGADIALPLAAEGLRIVLTQLFRNAHEAGARHVHLAAGPGWLQVADDGPGISAGNAARVFDPFFTTRREGGGTGMGLSVVRNLLAAHGAAITLEKPEAPPAPRGAVFCIRFG